MRSTSVLLSAALLSACVAKQEIPVAVAPLQYAPSAVAPGILTGPGDAVVVADGLVELIASSRPPGALSGPLRVEPPVAGEDALAQALVASLTRGGYAAQVGLTGPGHVLTYRAGPLDRGVVARATLDGSTHAARIFARSAGVLHSAGAGTIMQGPR